MSNHFAIHKILLQNYIIEALTTSKFCSLGKGQFKSMCTDYWGFGLYPAMGSELSKILGLQLQRWTHTAHTLGYLSHLF